MSAPLRGIKAQRRPKASQSHLGSWGSQLGPVSQFYDLRPCLESLWERPGKMGSISPSFMAQEHAGENAMFMAGKRRGKGPEVLHSWEREETKD